MQCIMTSICVFWNRWENMSGQWFCPQKKPGKIPPPEIFPFKKKPNKKNHEIVNQKLLVKGSNRTFQPALGGMIFWGPIHENLISEKANGRFPRLRLSWEKFLGSFCCSVILPPLMPPKNDLSRDLFGEDQRFTSPHRSNRNEPWLPCLPAQKRRLEFCNSEWGSTSSCQAGVSTSTGIPEYPGRCRFDGASHPPSQWLEADFSGNQGIPG